MKWVFRHHQAFIILLIFVLVAVYSRQNVTYFLVRFLYFPEAEILANLYVILLILVGSLISLNIKQKTVEKEGIHGLLVKAIKNNALTPFYQPIYSCVEGHYKMVGAEVLVRWHSEQGDFIPPSVFIPIAEKNNLIALLTDQLMTNVFKQIQLYSYPEHFFFSINVSPCYFECIDCATNLMTKLEKYNIKPTNLALEITERTKFTDLTAAASTVKKLRHAGISIKLDDCGTGYGAFTYLHLLNIDTIKVDKMFVDGIGQDAFPSSILTAIIAFSKEYDLQMVAEGIETPQQAAYLTQLGVQMLQGSLFSDAIPFNEFAQLLPFKSE